VPRRPRCAALYFTGRLARVTPGANRALAHGPEKWVPVSRLREAVAPFVVWLDASAGEGRSEKIMRQ
jgi:hypothetical protein